MSRPLGRPAGKGSRRAVNPRAHRSRRDGADAAQPPSDRAVVGDVLDVITRLAAGDLAARVPLPAALVEDDLAAVSIGLNMLAEELQVLRDGLETAVAERTTELRALEEQATYDAGHDHLTGLPNRRLLHQRLEHQLVRRREGTALLLLDLDGFKEVNDDLGHSIGDAVLVETATRLGASVRPGDTVARLGGDEFAVLLTGVDDSELDVVADRVLVALRAPMRVEGFAIALSASMGLVPTRWATSPEELLRLADLAMYRAKAAGRDRSCIYTEELMDQVRARREVEHGLRAALARDAVGVVYQPQVDARTQELVGVEALARWPHTDGRSWPPALFIPIAEQTGLIGELGAAVLRRACADAVRWHAATGQVTRFSVNVSGQQLADPAFADLVLVTLAAAGAVPAMLGIEVTESLLVEHQEGLGALARLREAGVDIAIDDFGTGYSSLSALRRLPVDTLKIDRSFVSGLGSDEDDGTIVRAVLSLARGLGLSVVAEGVETRRQQAELQQQRCQTLQGYLFGRPMPFADLLAWREARAPR